MAAHSDYPSRIPLRTAAASTAGTVGALVLVAVGVVAFVLSPADRRWAALHTNWMYWSSVAVGMCILAVALHLTNARWAWSVKRFALGGVAFLPVSLLLFPLMLTGGRHVYFHHWLAHGDHDPIAHDAVLQAKAAWLSFPGMLVRDLVALLVLFGLFVWFAYHQLRTDVQGLDRVGRDGWAYRWLGRGHPGDLPGEAARSHQLGYYIGVFAALAYAFAWGLIAVDVGMTTLPHFFSTMFPVAFFISAFHSGIAMTALMVVLWRVWLRLEDYITARQFHDLGKLLFAFAVFWMYINWSQYVVIWYGLLPNEQLYFVNKFREPFGKVAVAVVTMVFALPFFGILPRSMKKAPPILAGFSVIVLIGHWLERFLLATPNYWQGEGGLPLGLPEIGVALGFLGAFVACYHWYLRTFPLLPSPVTLAAAGSNLVMVPGPAKIAADS